MKKPGKLEVPRFMREEETNKKRFFKREYLKKKDPLIFYPILLSLGLILAQLLLIGLFITALPPQIPLFYSRAWGASQLSPPAFLWLLPSGSLSILLFNSFLSYLARGRLLPIRILMGFTLFTTASVFVTLFRIIVLVS